MTISLTKWISHFVHPQLANAFERILFIPLFFDWKSLVLSERVLWYRFFDWWFNWEWALFAKKFCWVEFARSGKLL